MTTLSLSGWTVWLTLRLVLRNQMCNSPPGSLKVVASGPSGMRASTRFKLCSFWLDSASRETDIKSLIGASFLWPQSFLLRIPSSSLPNWEERKTRGDTKNRWCLMDCWHKTCDQGQKIKPQESKGGGEKKVEGYLPKHSHHIHHQMHFFSN